MASRAAKLGDQQLPSRRSIDVIMPRKAFESDHEWYRIVGMKQLAGKKNRHNLRTGAEQEQS